LQEEIMQKLALGLLLAALPVLALAQTAVLNKSGPISPNDSMVRTPEVIPQAGIAA
jgi:hypothetical protein